MPAATACGALKEKQTKPATTRIPSSRVNRLSKD
jgi:hypothetical protein